MQYYTVILTPRAERQLAHIYEYIADESNEARAENFVSGIVADCMSLTTFPERGNRRDDIRPRASSAVADVLQAKNRAFS